VNYAFARLWVVKTTFFLFLLFNVAASASAASAPIDSGGTPLDRNRIADARRDVYHGRYTHAIATVTGVIDGSPNFAQAYLIRARMLTDAGRLPEALADADRVEAFHPNDSQVAMLRVEIALRQHDATSALEGLQRVSKASAFSFWKDSFEGNGNGLQNGFVLARTQHGISYAFAYASIAEEMLHHDDDALADLDQEMKSETEYPFYVLAHHCFMAAIADQLGMAELTCMEAIAKQNRDIGTYDSLGLVHLKMKQYAKAIDDYNHSLQVRPDLTVSLYGRGIARHATGDIAGGDADIAAARRDEPNIASIMASMGVKPGV
jgi:tetratricopeptide (TPR) repeat protein